MRKKAVILVSPEMEELIGLCNRVYVMYEGEIVGEFKPSEIAVEQLGLYMAGAKRDARKALSDNEGGEGNT